MVMFKTNKAVLEFITSQRHTYSQEDIKKIKTFIKERQKSRNEGVRDMKKINKKKSKEIIEMVKEMNKNDEEVGEEDNPLLQEVELSRKKEEDEVEMLNHQERRKSNDTTKSQEKGECRNIMIKSLISLFRYFD